jgi:DNA repair protein RadC
MDGHETSIRIAENHTEGISTAELLTTLVGGRPAAADRLLSRYGTLHALVRASADEVAGLVGRSSATRLFAGIELGRRSLMTPERKPRLRYAAEVNAYYQPGLGSLPHEVFHVACLDVRNHLLRDARVAQGGFASCAILPREVFAPALAAKAVGVIFVHNHPSGETEPSADDLQLTSRLVRAGEVLGIRVLDHVIVGSGVYTSLAERGQLR